MSDARAIHEARRNRLLAIAARFEIAGEQAESLADHVLYTFLLHDAGMANADDRLERLMAEACRRHIGRAVLLGLDPQQLEAVFPKLPPLTRQALRLYLHGNLNAVGVAEMLNVSPLYAAKLIFEAVVGAKKEIRKRQER